MTTITFEVPVRTMSEANLRGHWREKANRAKLQRSRAQIDTYVHLPPGGLKAGRIEITLTRIAPRGLDTDNLARALKAVRDGIADALRIDDGDERLSWSYRQEKRKPKEYSVRVEVSTL